MAWIDADWAEGYAYLDAAITSLQYILDDPETDKIGGKADIICLKFRLESTLRRWEELGEELDLICTPGAR